MEVTKGNEACSLLIKVIHLLTEDERTLEQIAMECGVRYHWLHAVKAGRIKHPSVNRVQRLYEFLSNHALQVEDQ